MKNVKIEDKAVIFKNFFFVIIILLPVFFSCNQTGKITEEEIDLFDSIVNSNKIAEVPPEVLSSILKSVPSPIEMTSIIHETGAKYESELLNTTDQSENYNTAFKKALNLGVYGADMGYLNMYNKTITSLSYLETIKGIADELKVGQFFDFSTLKRLASNKKNMDSIIYISTSSFDKMSSYLNNQNRSHISALILIGGWIEGLYLSTQIFESYPSPALAERIGEQKVAINNIELLLSIYKTDPVFSEIATQVNDLKGIYEKVEIIYTVGESTATIIDGMLVIEDNSKSEVKISEEQILSIVKKVSLIRNKIIA